MVYLFLRLHNIWHYRSKVSRVWLGHVGHMTHADMYCTCSCHSICASPLTFWFFFCSGIMNVRLISACGASSCWQFLSIFVFCLFFDVCDVANNKLGILWLIVWQAGSCLNYFALCKNIIFWSRAQCMSLCCCCLLMDTARGCGDGHCPWSSISHGGIG